MFLNIYLILIFFTVNINIKNNCTNYKKVTEKKIDIEKASSAEEELILIQELVFQQGHFKDNKYLFFLHICNSLFFLVIFIITIREKKTLFFQCLLFLSFLLSVFLSLCYGRIFKFHFFNNLQEKANIIKERKQQEITTKTFQIKYKENISEQIINRIKKEKTYIFNKSLNINKEDFFNIKLNLFLGVVSSKKINTNDKKRLLEKKLQKEKFYYHFSLFLNILQSIVFILLAFYSFIMFSSVMPLFALVISLSILYNNMQDSNIFDIYNSLLNIQKIKLI